MKFSKSHEWVACEGKTATIGISQEAAELLGNVTHVDLPVVGQEIKKDQPAALLEASKAATDFYSPLSGRVTAINEELKKNPSLLCQSPEKKGWLYKIEIARQEEMDFLLSEKEYRSFVLGSFES